MPHQDCCVSIVILIYGFYFQMSQWFQRLQKAVLEKLPNTYCQYTAQVFEHCYLNAAAVFGLDARKHGWLFLQNNKFINSINDHRLIANHCRAVVDSRGIERKDL